MKYNLIDRTDSFDDFNELLNLTNLVVVVSRKAVGKSRYIEEFLKEKKKYYSIYQCEIINSNLIFESGHFFDNLYKDYKEKIRFFRKIKDSINKIDISFNIPMTPISFDIIEEDIIQKQFKEINRYLKTSQNNIIVIQKINCCDDLSLKLFFKLIKAHPLVSFIFEYTIPDDDLLQIEEFKNTLYKNNINYNIYNLKTIDINYIYDFIKSNGINEQNKIELITTDYITKNGNIYNLFYNIKSFTTNQSIIDNDGALLLFSTIEEKYKLIVLIITLYSNKISLNDLIDILENHIIMNKNDLEIFLNESPLIEENNKMYKIYHESFLKLIQKYYQHHLFLTAKELLINFYDKKITCYKNYAYIYPLVFLLTFTNDERIELFFPYINRFLFTNQQSLIYYEQIEKIIKKIYLTNKNSNSEKMVLELVKNACKNGNYDIANSTLDTIYNLNNHIHVAYKALIYTQKNFHDIEKFIAQMKLKFFYNERFQLFLDLCLSNYYMKNKSDIYAKTFNESILKKKNYSEYIEYTFIKKNNTIYLPFDEAIRVLNDCIKEFRRKNRKDLAVRSQITLISRKMHAMDFAYAELNLKKLLKNSTNKEIKKYYILNNLGVVKLLKKDKSASVYLTEALLYEMTEYEELIVKSNLLVASCLVSNKRMCIDLIKQIESSYYEKYNFQQFLHVIYSNIYFYYIYINNLEKINFYKQKLIELKIKSKGQDLEKIIDCQLYNSFDTLSQKNEWYYLNNLFYHPGILGYWEVEIDHKM